MLENQINSMLWMPSYQWGARSAAICDQSFDDFDAQAERLVGHDQSYLQLSSGAFFGRFVSCTLGQDVSIHIEVANQALEQSVIGSDTAYSFGIVLSEPQKFRANGVEVGIDDVFVVPPNGQLHLRSPAAGIVLALVVERDPLFALFGGAPGVQDWFLDIGKHVRFLDAPYLAERLRQDSYSAMRSLHDDIDEQINLHGLRTALLNSMAAAIILGWGTSVVPKSRPPSQTFLTYKHGKNRMQGPRQASLTTAQISQELRMSQRSVQNAFNNETALGPSHYMRLLRLHDVRRDLRRSDERSYIGDVAARHGFWNLSLFGQQYRQLFGERPSDTRARASDPSRTQTC